MRKDGRRLDALRPVSVETGWKRQADGSVLYRAGGTVVLCVASVDEGVKDFMRGRGAGWVTAEYLMHPRTGPKRQSRDGFNGRPLSGRSQEIARAPDWGAETAFWRVAIKPGKPLLVATRGSQVILGLPGNPVSSFVTAFLFALPLVRAGQGDPDPLPRAVELHAGEALPAIGPRREFLRAVSDGTQVRLAGSAGIPAH